MKVAELSRVLRAMRGSLVCHDDELWRMLAEGSRVRVQTVNLHHLALVTTDAAFRDATLEPDVYTADGWPVVAAIRALGVKPERVTGSRLVARLVDPEERGGGLTRIALVGCTEAVGDVFASRLSGAGRELVFREHGRADQWDAADLAASIALCTPDLVLVAVSPPGGEIVARDIRRAGFGDCSVIAVGGAVDMAVGVQSPAPALIGRIGFEWVWRMAHAPRRLARRYLIECLPVAVSILPRAVWAVRAEGRHGS
jgi:N-acetylglucosaminyldiphosphoundecaprenol N-acetyl-beta-D-mannosaminyltransferase